MGWDNSGWGLLISMEIRKCYAGDGDWQAGETRFICHLFPNSFVLPNTSFPPRNWKDWACAFRTNTTFRWSASPVAKFGRQCDIRMGLFRADIGNVLTGVIGEKRFSIGGGKVVSRGHLYCRCSSCGHHALPWSQESRTCVLECPRHACGDLPAESTTGSCGVGFMACRSDSALRVG